MRPEQQRSAHDESFWRGPVRRHHTVAAVVGIAVLAMVCALVSPALLEIAQAGESDDEGSGQELITEPTTLHVDGDGFGVDANLTAEAQLPKDVTLDTKQVLPKVEDDSEDAGADAKDGSDSPLDDYDQLHGAALAKAKEQNDSLEAFGSESYYKISLKQDQEVVEPEAEVKVTLTFSDPVDVKDTAEVRVIGFAEKDSQLEATFLDKDKVEADAQDGKLNKLTFKTDSLAAFAVVTMPKTDEQSSDTGAVDNSSDDKGENDETSEELTQQTITGDSSDGASVEISGQLPKDATASIVPVPMSDEELASQMGDTPSTIMTSRVIYDISIQSNGKEWEPSSEVSVKVSNPALDVKDNRANVMVAHLEDGKASDVSAETENSAETITFKADSFSDYVFYTYSVFYRWTDETGHEHRWFMPGGTDTTLSQLFQGLGVTESTKNVTNLSLDFLPKAQETEKWLTANQSESADQDWKIQSNSPTKTNKDKRILIYVQLSGGQHVSIIAALSQTPYELDKNDLKPFTGSLSKRGKYDIFGGGNGISCVSTERTDTQKPLGGRWGWWSWYPDSSYYSWGNLKGTAVGNDADGNSLTGEEGKFKSGSTGTININGDVQRAFFSFGYGTEGNADDDILKVTIYAPKNGNEGIHDTATVTIHPKAMGAYSYDPNRPDSQYMSDTGASWKYLTFDATDFVKKHKGGDYTVVVEWTSKSDTAFNKDMGWTIYGYSEASNLPDSAIAIAVAEKRITADTPQQVNFSQAFTPNTNGRGKVWFNAHGGEYKKNGTDDHDSLELQLAASDGSTQFKKLGIDSSIRDTIPIYDSANSSDSPTKWDADDIARPNDEQTAPDGYTKFQNSFSFGMGYYNGSDVKDSNGNPAAVTGVRKTMHGGWDVFGSLMVMTPIDPAENSTSLTKQLKLVGSDRLPQDGANTTFKFKITRDDSDNPAPSNASGVQGDSNSWTVSTHFQTGADPNDASTGTINIPIGSFTFKNEGTYTYTVEEIPDNNNHNRWTYDTSKWTLTWKVSPTSEGSTTLSASASWAKNPSSPSTGQADSAETKAVFTNTYTSGSFSFNKIGLPAGGGSNTIALHGATFALYSDKECTTPVKDLNNTNSMATSDYAGQVRFTALPVDQGSTFYMKETSAPSGYGLNGAIYKVAFSNDAATHQITKLDDSNPTPASSLTQIEDPLLKISVKKTDPKGQALEGATFLLERRRGDLEYEVVKDVSGAGTDGTFTVDSQGNTLTGLPFGTYRLSEIKAPNGYNTLTGYVFFKVDGTGVTLLNDEGASASQGDSGEVSVGAAKLAPQDASNKSSYTLTITDTPGIVLPNAGGSGTTVFALVGGVCVAVAAALLARAYRTRA